MRPGNSNYPLNRRKASKRSIEILVRQTTRWSTWEIEAATGIDWKRFRNEITQAQDTAARKLAKICSEFAPKSYLSKIGGER